MSNLGHIATLPTMAIAFIVPLLAFGAAIYTCVDKKGPQAGANESVRRARTYYRSRRVHQAQQVKRRRELSLPPLMPAKPSAPEIQQSPPKRTSGTTKEMLEALEREQPSVVGAQNGVQVISSVICRLYEKYSEPDQRQLLLSQAQMLDAGCRCCEWRAAGGGGGGTVHKLANGTR